MSLKIPVQSAERGYSPCWAGVALSVSADAEEGESEGKVCVHHCIELALTED